MVSLNAEQATDHLAQVPIFQTLAPEDLCALAGITREVTYAPGEQIFGAGEPLSTLHIVLEGTVRLMEQESGGTMRLAATCEPGRCFGEIAWMTGQPLRLAALNGPSPGRHVLLDRHGFDALARRNPALGHAVMAALVDTLVRRSDHVPTDLRDYLIWGHRPRVAAPPGPQAFGTQAFLFLGAAWGVVGTLLWLGLEAVLMPQVVRTLTSMGLMMGALTVAGAAAGYALGVLLSALRLEA